MPKFIGTERENKLVEICFQLVSTVLDPRHNQQFMEMDREGKMQWVAEQLKGCGFPTMPVGMAWGVLVEPEPEQSGLRIVVPNRD